MLTNSPVTVVVLDESDKDFADQVARSLGYDKAEVIVGSLLDAANALSKMSKGPKYLILDIGEGSDTILEDLDSLAEYCDPGVKVVILGNVNDVSLYRQFIQRGIIEYFTKPAKVSDIRAVLMDAGGNSDSSVVSFISAASGDGGSTIASNFAYALSKGVQQKVVLIDMDYQFGMVARNLDLEAHFGIKEVFEHPDRNIDSTLIQTMLVEYSPNFYIVAAPDELQLMPNIKPEMIHDLVNSLKSSFDFIVLDVPHLWMPWVSAALNESDLIVMITQLWLRSTTHSTRLLGVMQSVGIELENVITAVNRSGAKFKEAITSKDFERVVNKEIDYYFSNDIRTISAAEKRGETIFDVGNSRIASEIKDFAKLIYEKLT